LFDAFNDTAIYVRDSVLPRHGTENFMSLEELVSADNGLWDARRERDRVEKGEVKMEVEAEGSGG
jgi:hypothetical protein